MATSRHGGSHNFESQLPIVATNLRALVSSWLPPAREPSPVDDERAVDGDAEGRPERYRSSIEGELMSRLALGATLSVTQPSTQFQSRMNRKMGIPTSNGIAKTDATKLVNENRSGGAKGSGKRKAETESDSEEDSRSKLIDKSSSKKVEQGVVTRKKKSSISHKALLTFDIDASDRR